MRASNKNEKSFHFQWMIPVDFTLSISYFFEYCIIAKYSEYMFLSYYDTGLYGYKHIWKKTRQFYTEQKVSANFI